MKKIFIIIFSALSLAAFAQQKSVAVLNPICRDNSVNNFYQQIVRGSMESAVTMTDEFVAFDRTAFDKVLEEHKFQQSGAVDDAQIRRMGVYAGVDFVLITEVSAYDGYMSLLVKILNIETGESSKGLSELMEQTPPIVQKYCKELAKKLFGIVDVASGIRKGTLQLPEGRYEGEIKNGKPHGKGTFYFTDGKKYVGDWNDGVRTGYGIFTTPDNSMRYEGYWVNNTFHGKGTLIYSDGRKYIGNIENGKASGRGVFYFSNGNRYEGSFADDVINGQGTFYYASGAKYIGAWKYGKKSGQGVFYFSDGDRYEGSFENDEINGYGTCYYSTGEKYVGNWKSGEETGYGTCYYSNGAKYVGNWENGNRSGYGTYYYSNGARFEGYWKNHEPNGKGVEYYKEGDYEEGTWVNGVQTGPAKYVKNKVEWLEGNYVNGKRDGDWIYYYWDGRQKKKKLVYSNGKIIRGGF